MVSFPPSRDLHDAGIEIASALVGRFFTTEPPLVNFSNFILLHVAKFCSNRIQFISLSPYRMQFCINLSVCVCVCVCGVVFKIFLRIIWNISLVP